MIPLELIEKYDLQEKIGSKNKKKN